MSEGPRKQSVVQNGYCVECVFKQSCKMCVVSVCFIKLSCRTIFVICLCVEGVFLFLFFCCVCVKTVKMCIRCVWCVVTVVQCDVYYFRHHVIFVHLASPLDGIAVLS